MTSNTETCVVNLTNVHFLKEIKIPTTFMVCSVTYPIWRCMLGYTDDQQLHHYCHLTTLDIQVHLLIYWHDYVQ